MNGIYFLLICCTFAISNYGSPSENLYPDFGTIENLTMSVSKSLSNLNHSLQDFKLDMYASSVMNYLRIKSDKSLVPVPQSTNTNENDQYEYGKVVNETDGVRRDSKFSLFRLVRDSEKKASDAKILRQLLLTGYEFEHFIQAHCFDEYCSHICFHIASDGETCAHHIFRAVPSGYSGFVTADVNPAYYQRCCGIREFLGRSCFVYTPQVGGPSISCFRIMLDDGKFSSQLPAP